MRILAASKTPIRAAVRAISGTTVQDPTSGTSGWCAVPAGLSTAGLSWSALTALSGAATASGTWESGGGRYWTATTVGGTASGAALALAAGQWRLHVRVVGSSAPVVEVSTLTVV